MKKLILIAFMIGLAFAGPSHAQLLYGVSQTSTAGGGGVVPSCSNAFDFSNACNSQYLGGM
jgi:hypothetical protein